jgi:FkbM family methyltransferase
MKLNGSTPKQIDLVYDVGMHRGQDTDYYLKRGYKVVGFEANPDNAAFCRERFAEAINSGRLRIVEGAITENFSQNGNGSKIRFFRNSESSFWGSTAEDWAVRNEVLGTRNETIEVEAVDFRQALEKYGVPFYLKADIVGSEMICVRALLGFEEKPDYLSIRSEKIVFRRLEEEFEILEKLGYDRFQAVQQDFTELNVSFDSPRGQNILHNFEEGASGIFGEDLPQKWKTSEQALKEYRKIFVYYWLFGDYSYLIQTKKGKSFVAQLERIARRPLPGWYDTHAKHSSVK